MTMTEMVSALVTAGFVDNKAECRCTNTVIHIDNNVDPGDAEWEITMMDETLFTVAYRQGWYEQDGEAHGVSGVIKLMNAMNKASAALNNSIRGCDE
jgi:hypothetical protein